MLYVPKIFLASTTSSEVTQTPKSKPTKAAAATNSSVNGVVEKGSKCVFKFSSHFSGSDHFFKSHVLHSPQSDGSLLGLEILFQCIEAVSHFSSCISAAFSICFFSYEPT